VVPKTSAVTIVQNNTNLRAQESPERSLTKVPLRRARNEFIDAAGQRILAMCMGEKKAEKENEYQRLILLKRWMPIDGAYDSTQ
jgi:hypothetical protein